VRITPVLLALLLGVLALPPAVRGQHEVSSELTEATIVEQDAAVEVWVRLTRPTRYQGELMDSPWRLVLDFEETAYRWSARPTPVGTEPVRELRGSQFRKGVARLVIELRQKVAYTIEEDREGLRIVLPRGSGPAAASAREASTAPAPGARVAPAPAPGPRPASRGLQAFGTVMLNEQRHAYIFDPGVGQVRRYGVGDKVGNGVVETIGEWTVVLRTPTGPLELRVDGVRPDPAPPRPPPPTRLR
jgi:hypothetical protein